MEVSVCGKGQKQGCVYPVPGVPGFMLTLTGERFRVCVQVRAQVQLGNVLFLSPLAAAVVTNPQSLIHTQARSFYMQNSARAPVSLRGTERETDAETETGALS